jgi:hypothetical protein
MPRLDEESFVEMGTSYSMLLKGIEAIKENDLEKSMQYLNACQKIMEELLDHIEVKEG